jgi:hypothetical protein
MVKKKKKKKKMTEVEYLKGHEKKIKAYKEEELCI